MSFEYASEGFLDLFKKKSKEPSKIEKSDISDRLKPGKTLVSINDKLMELYPEDAEKEFKKRKVFLKELLNIIAEAEKKFGNIPGLKFNTDDLKAAIQGKDNKDTYFYYDDFGFMQDIIPSNTPKSKNDEMYGFNEGYNIDIFGYDIWTWANEGKYKDEFKSNKRIVRNFEDTKEWWKTLEDVVNWYKSKLEKNEFVYMIVCGGDWDDGSYCVTLKPSNEMQQLAQRCSNSYKAF